MHFQLECPPSGIKKKKFSDYEQDYWWQKFCVFGDLHCNTRPLICGASRWQRCSGALVYSFLQRWQFFSISEALRKCGPGIHVNRSLVSFALLAYFWKCSRCGFSTSFPAQWLCPRTGYLTSVLGAQWEPSFQPCRIHRKWNASQRPLHIRSLSRYRLLTGSAHN